MSHLKNLNHYYQDNAKFPTCPAALIRAFSFYSDSNNLCSLKSYDNDCDEWVF